MDEWIYSSYRAFLSDKNTKIKRQEVLKWFGGEITSEQFHKENLTKLQDDWEFETL